MARQAHPHPHPPAAEPGDEKSQEPLVFLKATTSTDISSPSRSQPAHAELPWRPLYLRRRVLAGFAAVFVALVAVIEALYAVSNHNQGLATSHSGLHYLWTYGPTAAFIAVASVWARVAFQAKLAAPWIRMQQGPADAERTMLLDYLSMFPPAALFKSARNRDFLVTATTAVQLIFSGLIVFSTGLITLSPAQVTLDSAPVTIQTAFVNSDARLASAGPLAYFNLYGLNNGTLKHPDGSSEQYAYQTISTDLDRTAEVQTTVEGLAGGLDCEPATINYFWIYSNRGAGNQYDISISTPGCDILLTHESRAPYTESTYMSRFVAGSCGGSTALDDQRVVAFWGYVEIGEVLSGIKPNGSATTGPLPVYKSAKFLRSAQMLCKPTYSIRNVDLVKNGTDTQSVVSVPSSPSRALSNVHPWSIAQSQFDSFGTSLLDVVFYTPILVNIAQDPVNVDIIMYTALDDPSRLPVSAEAMTQNDYFESYLNSYYQLVVALIARQGLMEPASVPSTGSARLTQDRLLVRPLAAHLIVGFLLLAALLTALCCLRAPNQGVLPRDPSTLLGQATLFAHSPSILQRLRDMGAAHSQAISQVMGDYTYHTGLEPAKGASPLDKAQFMVVDRQISQLDPNSMPMHPETRDTSPFPIRPSLRITACFLVAGIIAALEGLLHLSDENVGLGDVGDETYLHYVWTTLPAAILTLLSMYFGSVDFAIRSFTPYSLLATGAPFDRSINLNLLDLSIPRVLWRELRTGTYAAFLGTVTLFITAFLTIVTSSLFVPAYVPLSYPTQLVAVNSLTSNETIANATRQHSDLMVAASLVLESNMSYPAFTYEDLAMPGLALPADFEAASRAGGLHTESLVFNATVPAVRSRLACKVYDSSHITTRFLVNNSIYHTDILSLYVDGEPCTYNARDTAPFADMNIHFMTGSPTPGDSYFGVASTDGYGNTMGYERICSDFVYFWGHISRSPNLHVDAVSAMACNETLETVDVDASFVGTDLAVDEANPPVPDETSVRESAASVGTKGLLYLRLVDINMTSNPLSNFFGLLTSSRYAIPVTVLGDAAQTQHVADAVQFQHRVIRAVTMGSNFRVPADQSNATLGSPNLSADSAAAVNDALPYAAMATDSQVRRRVIQDAASTRTLQALLACILLLTVSSWLLMRRTALLPRHSSSVASTLAMLAGGNVFDCLPKNPEWLSDEELEAHFRSLGVNGFRMGWGTVDAGAESDGRLRFMISSI